MHDFGFEIEIFSNKHDTIIECLYFLNDRIGRETTGNKFFQDFENDTWCCVGYPEHFVFWINIKYEKEAMEFKMRFG